MPTLLFEHMHIIGGSGSGKTSLGIATLIKQLIQRNDGPVVVVDCKGDPAFFHTVRWEAQRFDRTFKWFTNKPYLSTHVFNPFAKRFLERLTMPEVIGLLLQSLNLFHGQDYGRAYFTIAARILLKHAVEETVPENRRSRKSQRSRQRPLFREIPTIRSFRDLHEIICFITRDGKDYQAAQHVSYLVESLADFQQLNMSPERDPKHPALQHAIHIPEVIRRGQVVYFYLVGAMDLASVGEIARLALYSLLAAAIAHKDRYGVTPRIYFVCDEAQSLIAQNIQVVLAQARSHGLACILAHQTMSQLNPPGGVDLRELVMGCTAVKQIFSARDPWLQRYVSEMSGQVKYCRMAYDQSADDVLQGRFGPAFALCNRDGEQQVYLQEYFGPRLTSEDIRDISREENMSILGVEHNKGLSQFAGWFPIHTDWPVPWPVYEKRRDRTPWPSVSSATIEIESEWPQAQEFTITPVTHPPLIGSPLQTVTGEKLSQIMLALGQR